LTYRLLFFLMLWAMGACQEAPSPPHPVEERAAEPAGMALNGPEGAFVKGALLTKKFQSLQALESEVDLDYDHLLQGSVWGVEIRPLVRFVHKSCGHVAGGTLAAGVSQKDFIDARDGGLGEKLWLVIHAPYAVWNKGNLQKAYYLARRIDLKFGVDDVAFYDFAEAMMCNIRGESSGNIPSEYLSEKGYINTFNHVTGQAFVTSIFSARLASLIADAHERSHLPQLITGTFTNEQLVDVENGAVDNYVDLINNKWGQKLGEMLREKYHIHRKTRWHPELLANYLNDLQAYFSWALKVDFQPFRASDELIVRFSEKLNIVLKTPA
jgi:hypothetical protein